MKVPDDEHPQEFGHPLLYQLEASSRAKFLESVALAIDAIRRRNITAEKADAEDAQSDALRQVDDTNNAQRAKEQVIRYLDDDPLLAVMLMRIGAEALAKDLYRHLGHERKESLPEKNDAGRIAETCEGQRRAGGIETHNAGAATFGNFAAHHQGEQSKYLTRDIASAVLALYEQAQAIYGEWSKLQR